MILFCILKIVGNYFWVKFTPLETLFYGFYEMRFKKKNNEKFLTGLRLLLKLLRKTLSGLLTGFTSGLKFSTWCRWSESNRHAFRHTILSRACLPIPPQRLYPLAHINIFIIMNPY